MTLALNIIAFTLTLSLITFIAFFGRLPAFRHTPVGWTHRLIVLHIPNGLRKLDNKLTNGRITNGGSRFGQYLMNDKHPLVVIFFLGLLTACVALFLPVTWPHLQTRHKLIVTVLIPQPYAFLYLSSKYNSQTYISHHNHAEHMRNYPYDRILFYPGYECSTCMFLKPARSKHCSICKTCVARMDHHCIWVNNCVGRGNYKWFLALLWSTTVLIAYGAYLAYITLTPLAINEYERYEQWYVYVPKHGFDPSTWSTYVDMKGHYFLAFKSIYLEVGGIRGSGVGLLALLTWPLPLGLLLYHVYLIWAGMTTNESAKWADWKDDMAEGVVFLGLRRDKTMGMNSTHLQENDEPPTSWPIESRHILVRTRDGQPPKVLPPRIVSVAQEDSFQRVWNLAAVENVYDLGLWDNVKEVLLR